MITALILTHVPLLLISGRPNCQFGWTAGPELSAGLKSRVRPDLDTHRTLTGPDYHKKYLLNALDLY